MIAKQLSMILALFCCFFSQIGHSQIHRYAEQFCTKEGYYCIKAKKSDTWEKLFAEAHEREVVQRLNRTENRLYPGMVVVVPNRLKEMTVWDISPFVRLREPRGEKVIIVDQDDLAWGAYDEHGVLVGWGPISSGKNFCPDTQKNCETVTGEFRMYRKSGGDCVSRTYPIGKGGARMPYCMFFHGGFALHGSYDLPGYRASHGCVRLFPEDARWLNKVFIDIPHNKKEKGTLVIVEKP